MKVAFCLQFAAPMQYGGLEAKPQKLNEFCLPVEWF